MFDATAQAVTEKAQREAEARSWTTDTEILATIAELVSATNAILIKANSAKGASTPETLRIPRPYDDKATGEAPVVSGREILRMTGEG